MDNNKKNIKFNLTADNAKQITYKSIGGDNNIDYNYINKTLEEVEKNILKKTEDKDKYIILYIDTENWNLNCENTIIIKTLKKNKFYVSNYYENRLLVGFIISW